MKRTSVIVFSFEGGNEEELSWLQEELHGSDVYHI